MGDVDEAEEDLDCWDQLDEGVPAPHRRELMEYAEGSVVDWGRGGLVAPVLPDRAECGRGAWV